MEFITLLIGIILGAYLKIIYSHRNNLLASYEDYAKFFLLIPSTSLSIGIFIYLVGDITKYEFILLSLLFFIPLLLFYIFSKFISLNEFPIDKIHFNNIIFPLFIFVLYYSNNLIHYILLILVLLYITFNHEKLIFKLGDLVIITYGTLYSLLFIIVHYEIFLLDEWSLLLDYISLETSYLIIGLVFTILFFQILVYLVLIVALMVYTKKEVKFSVPPPKKTGNLEVDKENIKKWKKENSLLISFKNNIDINNMLNFSSNKTISLILISTLSIIFIFNSIFSFLSLIILTYIFLFTSQIIYKISSFNENKKEYISN